MNNMLIIRRTMMVPQNDVRRYVQDGLVLHMDGIEKGQTPNAWTSLVGGHVFTESGGVVFNDDNLQFSGSQRLANTSLTVPSMDIGTIEVVIDAVDIHAFETIFSSIVSNRLAFGLYTSGIRWATSSKPTYLVSDNASSVSVSNVRCVANSVILSSGTNGWVVNTGASENLIGCRYNNGYERYFNGKIHAIRIYNRQLTENEVLNNQRVDMARFGIGC